MVKLTPDLIQQSMQYINSVRDRELDLRGYKIPVIENMGATLDQFDTVDFSDNDIRKLDGFPLLKRLKCLLLNNNRIVYTIREQLLDDGMVSELGISHTYRHDTGVLSCYASSAYGQGEMVIQLIVQEVPEMPKNIRVNDQQSRPLQLSWTQPYAGNSAITNYIIQYKLVSDIWQAQPLKLTVPGTQTSATVQNLNPACSYHLRIMAENRLGLSDPSEVNQVTTQEEVPSGAPVDIRAEARSSTELFVSWEPPERELWNGNLLGYYVGYQEQSSLSAVSSSPSTTTHNYNFKTVEVGAQYGGEVVLQGLAKYTTYSIMVQAYNSRGAGPSSDHVTARTQEDVPSLPPENVQCSALTSQSLQVSWEPPPLEGRNGVVMGYKVSHQPAEEWYGG